MTAEERRARDRARYAANPGPKKARAKAYRQSNPKKAAAAVAAWRVAHPERVRELGRETCRRYAENHPDRVKANRDRWRAENAEHRAEYMRAWREANPELVAEHHKRRRARRKGALGSGFESLEDLHDTILVGWENACAYCGTAFASTVRLQMDHVVPLSRGGSHFPENLVPACGSCNNSKNDKLLSEWRDGKHAEFVPTHAAAIAAALRERRAC